MRNIRSKSSFLDLVIQRAFEVRNHFDSSWNDGYKFPAISPPMAQRIVQIPAVQLTVCCGL